MVSLSLRVVAMMGSCVGFCYSCPLLVCFFSWFWFQFLVFITAGDGEFVIARCDDGGKSREIAMAMTAIAAALLRENMGWGGGGAMTSMFFRSLEDNFVLRLL